MTRWVVALLLVVGCSSGDAPGSRGTDGGAAGTDGSGGVSDDAAVATAADAAMMPSCPPCAADQVCSGGACVALPNHCPCPHGSYCDLASNACKRGCVADSDCDTGAYCDTGARQCKPGCRGDSDCGATDACTMHQCTGCTTNCDDANPCTLDSCVKGACAHSAGNDGAACPDDGDPCTSDVCRAGACDHPGGHDGATCADDGDPCSLDLCKGGACTHPPGMPDDTSCSSDPKLLAYCKAGRCTNPAETCDHGAGDLLYYGGMVTDRQTRGCGCTSTTSMIAHFDPATVFPPDTTWQCPNGCDKITNYDLCF